MSPASAASGRTALVLSGGGSRGAYEVGVLQYLRGALRKRLGRHIDRGDLETTSLQLEGVAAGAGAEIEHPAAAQIEGRDLEIGERLVIRAVELVHRGRFVVPEIGVDDEPGFRGPAVVVEEGAAEGVPASFLGG